MFNVKLNASAVREAAVGRYRRVAQTVALISVAVAGLAPSASYAQLSSDQLTDVEQIKQLKAQYFRFIDTKDWTDWANVFAPDATVQATALCITVNYSGRSQIASSVSKELQKVLTVHRGFMPEITLTSATTATGIWEMEDRIRYTPLTDYHGYGYYHETYVKQNGQWYIQSTVLTRIREEIDNIIVGKYVNGVRTCP
jgi:hypothetical protein